MANMETSDNELKRSNPPPSCFSGGNELKTSHTSTELSSSRHEKHTNMSDKSNREQAFTQQSTSFNDVQDEYTEQAFTFSANESVTEEVSSPKIEQEFTRINQTESRLVAAIDHIDGIEEEFGNVKESLKVREYIEDEDGNLNRVKKDGSVSKHKSKLSEKDKQNRVFYRGDPEALKQKSPRDLVRSHSYSKELYLDDEGNEIKKVKVEDRKIDRESGKRKLLKRAYALDAEEGKIKTIQRSGRLLFHGENLLSNAKRSLDQKGNATDEAAKKAVRYGAYGAGKLLTGALEDGNRIKKATNKAYRYKSASEKAKLEANKLSASLRWQKDKLERDMVKDRYRRSQKSAKDRKEKREKLRELHKKQDSFFQRTHHKKLIKKKKKELVKEARKQAISLIGPLAITFIVIILILLLLLLPFFLMISSLGSGIGEFTSQNSYTTLAMTNEFFSDLMAEYEMFVSPGFEDNYESILAEAFPDIYEFEYDLPDEFRYDTVLLKAYLSAKYQTYDMTDEEVQNDLKEIFELYATYEYEIKKEYRDVPKEGGGTERKLVDICYIKAELHDLEEIVKARVDENGAKQIDKYVASGLGLNVFGPVMAQSWGYSGADFRVSSEFGYRVAPKEGASTNHGGVDIACPTGTKLYSAVTGTVALAGDSGKGGLRVKITDEDTGVSVVFMHMSSIGVSVGEHVNKGQYVGLSGNTGNTTGPHLHLEVHDPDGNKHDPRDYIPSNIY